jgi:twitching motility protein PilI
MLGLKNPEDFVAESVDSAAPAWGAARFSDSQGHIWRKLSVRELLADNDFMNIGV